MIRQAQLKLHCVGTGDAFGSGGRLNSCFYLQHPAGRLLLDCGSSSLIGLQRLGLDPTDLDTVIVSHLHGDHFGGVPYLLLDGAVLHQRRRPLTLIGPPGLEDRVNAALEAQYPGALAEGCGFPLDYRQLDPERPLEINQVRISGIPVCHGGGRPAFGIRLEVAGRTLGYTGDTEWTEALYDLAQGCDLLISECFAYAPPAPGHLDYQTLLAKRSQLACRRLVLTHPGPDVLARSDELEIPLLADGQVLNL